MTTHDNGYKNLFSHPQMIEDLLRGFVHEDWVTELDFSSLEKVSGSYVSDDLRDREDDIIWKVRWGQSWLYIYLLLEFQSRPDSFMAIRILTYVGLLYQELIKTKCLSINGKLPPVFPLVLYNGLPRWKAATDVVELIEPIPGGLTAYRPNIRYLLLDEGALAESDFPAMKNLAAALFRLERSQDPADMQEVIGALKHWLDAPEQTELRRAFTVWIKRVLLPRRLPGIHLPEISDLHEAETMLAERVIEWTKDWKQQGLQGGRQEGRQEGRQVGRQEGIQEGIHRGEAAILERLLVRRFGTLTEEIKQKLENASTDQLEDWALNVLEANNLQDVFN
ncbi:MAG: Rpn family recombination-promoting nuclease/putative transposase [Methylococcaceae bacterium]